jgi:hypothetical protein
LAPIGGVGLQNEEDLVKSKMGMIALWKVGGLNCSLIY